MKALIIGLFLSSSVSFAATSVSDSVKMHAGQYTCSEFRQAVRAYGKVVVVFGGGWAARAFYANPNECHFTEYPVERYFGAKNGEACYLRWACEYDDRYSK